MARVLIVGCGCRGRSLASALIRDGHIVRGTTRSEATLGEIRAAGAEAVLADPDRLATVLPQVEGVSVLCWLISGDRLPSLVAKLIDTPVRGLVYEAGDGAEGVREACDSHRIPLAVIDRDPTDHNAWLASCRSAVNGLLWHPSAPEVGTGAPHGQGRPD